jgi:hypothetical protein
MQTASAGLARPSGYGAQPLAPRVSLQVQDVVLHHLRTPADIQGIVHLREEIDLSVHTAAGPQFGWLEKKETSAASCAVSSSAASGWARSASSRWATT